MSRNVHQCQGSTCCKVWHSATSHTIILQCLAMPSNVHQCQGSTCCKVWHSATLHVIILQCLAMPSNVHQCQVSTCCKVWHSATYIGPSYCNVSQCPAMSTNMLHYLSMPTTIYQCLTLSFNGHLYKIDNYFLAESYYLNSKLPHKAEHQIRNISKVDSSKNYSYLLEIRKKCLQFYITEFTIRPRCSD